MAAGGRIDVFAAYTINPVDIGVIPNRRHVDQMPDPSLAENRKGGNEKHYASIETGPAGTEGSAIDLVGSNFARLIYRQSDTV